MFFAFIFLGVVTAVRLACHSGYFGVKSRDRLCRDLCLQWCENQDFDSTDDALACLKDRGGLGCSFGFIEVHTTQTITCLERAMSRDPNSGEITFGEDYYLYTHFFDEVENLNEILELQLQLPGVRSVFEDARVFVGTSRADVISQTACQFVAEKAKMNDKLSGIGMSLTKAPFEEDDAILTISGPILKRIANSTEPGVSMWIRGPAININEDRPLVMYPGESNYMKLRFPRQVVE